MSLPGVDLLSGNYGCLSLWPFPREIRDKVPKGEGQLPRLGKVPSLACLRHALRAQVGAGKQPGYELARGVIHAA